MGNKVRVAIGVICVIGIVLLGWWTASSLGKVDYNALAKAEYEKLHGAVQGLAPGHRHGDPGRRLRLELRHWPESQKGDQIGVACFHGGQDARMSALGE